MASLWELGPIIFGPTEDLVSWLQRKGLLASSQTCSSCGGLARGVISRTEVCGGVRGGGSGTASMAMAYQYLRPINMGVWHFVGVFP